MESQVATRVGDRVPEEFRGRAYAVYPSVCYIRDEDGEQLVLLDERCPAAPHGINVPLASRDFRQVIARDARVNLESGVLTVTGAMSTKEAYLLETAPKYDATLAPADLARRDKVRHAMEAAAEAAATCEADNECADRTKQAARRRVRSTLDRLRAALLSDDRARVHSLVSGLIGFGPGVSPYGDAAVVGFLAARYSVGIDDGFGPIAEKSANHTSEMSWGYLSAAIAHRFSEPVRELAVAIRDGKEAAASAAATRCLYAEQSGGLNLVAGLLAGFEVTLAAEEAVAVPMPELAFSTSA